MRPIVARDVMNPSVLTAQDDWTLAELASFLADNKITGAPVVDEDGFVCGVVSVVDVVRDVSWPSGGSYLHVPDRAVGAGGGGGIEEVRLKGDEMSVRELMTPEIVSVDTETTVSEVARTMLRHHLHRLLVVEEGQLVGLISTSDLLGLLIDED
ncbi:MAG: CBS domain-containing protein [Acidobacteriota bacterium]